jgi:isoleucyl-tRNA synthetase
MHKSWGNDIPFDEAADGVGADIMRWLFAGHPVESNLNFGYSVLDSVKARLLVLWNTYSFLVRYSNIDRFDPAGPGIPVEERPLLDRWIVARFNELVLDVRGALDSYDAASGTRAVDSFIEDLSTWYVRRSRRRFWKSGLAGEDAEKRSAYITLYESLKGLALVMAPFVPFISEHMYRNLVVEAGVQLPESVHLNDYPAPNPDQIDRELLEAMRDARKLVSLGRFAREQAQIKVRQPLGTIYVRLPNGSHLSTDLEEIVLEELNVKKLEYAAADADFVDYRVRPNLPPLGRRYGKEVPLIKEALARIPPAEVAAMVQAANPVIVTGEARSWTLDPEEILVEAVRKEGFAAAAADGYLVALDTTISRELRQEGLARELVRAVNDLRKQENLQLDDRISISIVEASLGFVEALDVFGQWVQRETLAVALDSAAISESTAKATLEVEGEAIEFGVEKVRAIGDSESMPAPAYK